MEGRESLDPRATEREPVRNVLRRPAGADPGPGGLSSPDLCRDARCLVRRCGQLAPDGAVELVQLDLDVDADE